MVTEDDPEVGEPFPAGLHLLHVDCGDARLEKVQFPAPKKEDLISLFLRSLFFKLFLRCVEKEGKRGRANEKPDFISYLWAVAKMDLIQSSLFRLRAAFGRAPSPNRGAGLDQGGLKGAPGNVDVADYFLLFPTQTTVR